MQNAGWAVGLAALMVAGGCSSSGNNGSEATNAGSAGDAGASSNAGTSAGGVASAGRNTADAGAGARSGAGGVAGEPTGGPDAGAGAADAGASDGGADQGTAGTSASGAAGASATGGTAGIGGAGIGGSIGLGGNAGAAASSGGGASGSGGSVAGAAGGGLAGAGGGTAAGGGGSGAAGGGAAGAGGGSGCAEGSTGPNCSVCVVYVNKSNGNDSNDGRTWATAKSNVQNGIDAAFANSSPCQVWVAQGTYVPTYMADPFASPKTATLLMRASVALYGGFAGNEHALEARNIAVNVTTLSGAITVSGKADFLNNVVTAADGGTLDGFTVSGGGAGAVQCNTGTLTLSNDTLSANSGPEGGALRLETCSATIASCTFNNNGAKPGAGSEIANGGSIYNNSGNLTIRNSAFSNSGTNARYGSGGAIFSGGPTDIRDTTFTNNSAPSGGALYVSNTSVLVQGCTFSANRAFGGSAIYAPLNLILRASTVSNNTATVTPNSTNVSGAINGRDVTVEDSNFVGNTAIATDGGTTALGGGLYAFGVVKIKNSSFRNGFVSAGNGSSGAGFYCAPHCSAQLARVSFDGNVAKGIGTNSTYGAGAAVYFAGDSISLDNCQFTNNQAKAFGGAIYHFASSGTFLVSSSTFYGNTSATGGAVYIRSAAATFLNSIFWGNTATTQGNQVFNAGSGGSTVRACDVQGSGFTGANGNIDQNPLFVSTAAGALDLRLQSGSPCSNSGSSTDLALDALDLDGDANVSEPVPFDIDGNTRVQNGTPDQGAHESSY